MKKMLAIVLSLLMVQMYLPCITHADNVYSTADQNGIYVLTPENAVDVTGGLWSTDNNMIYRAEGNFSSEETVPTQSVTYGFDFSGDENVGYDLWILSTFNDNSLSTPMYAFDNDESKRWAFTTEGWNNQSVAPYTNDLAGSTFALYWSKVESNKTFTKGEHTLKYSVSNRWFDKYVLTCYGGAVLVPSVYNWTPGADTILQNGGRSTVENSFVSPYAWIELEKYKSCEQFIEEDDPYGAIDFDPAVSYSDSNNYSGNGCLLMEGKQGEVKYTYDFRLDDSDSYDIWFLGTEFAMHLSDFDWGIDINNDNELIKRVDFSQYNSGEVYKATSQSFSVKWQKVAGDVEINEGSHILTYKQNYRYIAPDRWGQADCIAIVPSDLDWQPSASDKADAANANLDAKAMSYALEKKYKDGISNNLELPKIGPAGSRYTYQTLTPDVISNSGIIFPAYDADMKAELNVTATKNVTAGSSKASLTVLANPEITAANNKVYILSTDEVVATEGAEWATDYETIYRIEKDITDGSSPVYSVSYGFNFDGNENVGYDVWVLSTFNNGVLSVPMYSFDNDSPKTWDLENEGWNNQKVSPYINYLKGSPFQLFWSKVETNKTFTNGEHIFKYSVEKNSAYNWILSCLGGAVLVPSSYNWTPNDNTITKSHDRSTVETEFINPYALIELENFKSYSSETANANPCLGWNRADYSGSGCLNMGGAEGEVTYKYDFELDKAGVYDIWFLGTTLDWSPLSNFKWGVDISSEDELIKCKQLQVVNNVYNEAIANFEVMWQKAAEDVSLTSGDHIFTYKQLYRLDGPQRWGQADCIVIVPKGMEWIPTTNDKGAQLGANLDVLGLSYHLDKKYSAGAKSDIRLPEAGPAGSRYSYQAITPKVIDENGVIYPIAGEEQQGVFNVTSEKTDRNATASKEQYVYITVAPADGIVVKNFELVDNNDNKLTTLSGGSTVYAHASVLNGSPMKSGAVMVIAIYNSNGSLNSVIKNDLSEITDEYQVLSASMTLPEDVSGMTVKAYIWNNLSEGKPLADYISVK